MQELKLLEDWTKIHPVSWQIIYGLICFLCGNIIQKFLDHNKDKKKEKQRLLEREEDGKKFDRQLELKENEIKLLTEQVELSKNQNNPDKRNKEKEYDEKKSHFLKEIKKYKGNIRGVNYQKNEAIKIIPTLKINIIDNNKEKILYLYKDNHKKNIDGIFVDGFLCIWNSIIEIEESYFVQSYPTDPKEIQELKEIIYAYKKYKDHWSWSVDELKELERVYKIESQKNIEGIMNIRFENDNKW